MNATRAPLAIDAEQPAPATKATPRQAPAATALFDALLRLADGGGERDDGSLRRFADTVVALRALPGATGAFRARVASAGGWAALLFSSWRFRRYDSPERSGATRVREFIARDVALARAIAPRVPSVRQYR